MKKSDIYEIAIKIFGIQLFITSARLASEIFYSFSVFKLWEGMDFFNPTIYVILSFFNFGIVFLIAFTFVFRTKRIIRIICEPQDFDEDIKLFTEKKNIYEIVLRITCLLIVMSTLPEFSYKFIDSYKIDGEKFPGTLYTISSLVISIIKLFVAFFVFIWAKEIGVFLSRNKDKTKTDGY